MKFPPSPLTRSHYPLNLPGGLAEQIRGWWSRKPQRAFHMGISIAVLIYSGAVLCEIIWTGDIGVRCFFGTRLKEEVPGAFQWNPARPHLGDTLVSIDGGPIAYYTDYIRAMRHLGSDIGRQV